MPFSRPTLSDLRKQVMADINASASGANAFLRKAVLRVMAIAQAGLAHLHFGYLDYIAKQGVPWTATGENLAAWGAMKGIYQKNSVATRLAVEFSGTPGRSISSGVKATRRDGEGYSVMESVTVGGDGKALVIVEAVTPGTAGNCAAGEGLTLATTIEGVQSTGVVVNTITTGVDVEDSEAFGERIMDAYQEAPQGGDRDDYKRWALGVPGVTRAWCSPNGFGVGTVVLRFMMDSAQAAHDGFPQGSDGVSQFDQGPDGLPRDLVATGDQLTLADAIIDREPVTALVFACAPKQNRLVLTISGLSNASTATRNSIASSITDMLFRNADPRAGTINRNDIEGAINSVAGTSGWLMESITGTVDGVTTPYPGNITSGMGELPVLDEIIYL